MLTAQPEKLLRAGNGIGDGILTVENDRGRRIRDPETGAPSVAGASFHRLAIALSGCYSASAMAKKRDEIGMQSKLMNAAMTAF